jgi:CoA:oxalate CoA-transferase
MPSPGDRALPLAGWTVAVPRTAPRSVAVCADHLRLLGAREAGGTDIGRLVVHPPDEGKPADPLSCALAWTPLGAPRGTDEAIIQATSGLMAVHGGESRTPRRLGLDVASVAAGVLATQGILAAQLARLRGVEIREVRTSVLQGALAYLQHHLAIGTCGGTFPFQPLASGAGPPFPTADGAWVELEALGGDAWIAFWKSLGIDETQSSRAWLPFVYRYLAGRCTLPAALHDATRRLTCEALLATAASHRLAACRVRAANEVGAEGACRPWTFGEEGTASGEWSGEWPAARAATVAAPLAGWRVVEVTSRLQGPLAGHLLQQLGADVVKVEPRGGDFGRCSPPFAGSHGAAYLAYNHGKRVEELDYKCAADRARLMELVAGSDVFLHNWPRGRAHRLGLDAGTLARCNAQLVYAQASGWDAGMTEPSTIAGDQLVQAHAGCGDLLSPPDQPGFPSRLTIVDTMGGLLACEGILAALCLRARRHRGVSVDTSLFGGAMTLRGDARDRPAWGSFERPIATADGHLVVRAVSSEQRRFVVRQRFANRPAAEWVERLGAVGIPAAPVHTDLSIVPAEWVGAGVVEHVDDAAWVPAAPWAFSA